MFLYGPLLDDPRYIVGGGAADNGASLGALLELILVVANIGTAVVLWPVLKRVNEILALGFVTARIVESAFIAIGVLSLLTVVALRQGAAAGADASSLVTVGESLVALHDWTFLLGPGLVAGTGTGGVSRRVPVGEALVALQDWAFLLGPGFVVGIGNGLILGYLMYRSGLVPRGMALLGLVAGPFLIARFVGILFGVFEPMSVLGSLMVVPEFVWELSFGIWLVVKGFNPSAVASLSTNPDDGVLTGVEQPVAVPSNGQGASKG